MARLQGAPPARILGWMLPLRLLALLLVGVVATAAAAEERRSAAVHRTSEPPRIDGLLDDAVWQVAAPIGPLVQKEPVEGAEPSERTEVRVATDGHSLFFGIRCFDREPEQLIAAQMRRDVSLQTDDRVSLMLGPYHDRRNGYLFSTNPNGSRLDGISEANQNFRGAWDGIWTAKTNVDAEGWTAEIAIPFETLSFDPQVTRWDFNFLRAIRRRNELAHWTSPSQSRSFTDLSQVGELTGLRDLEQGLGLDVVPTGAASFTMDRRDDRQFTDLDPSLDVFYKLTPSVTGALTFNTDFSDAPVDARQVNLSRFALFFPETRDFFLQDAGIFDFGDLFSRNGIPFFSRRIGIADDGDIVGIRSGLKATGRVGRVNFGLIDVQMDDHGDIDGRNLSVGRVKVNLLENSYVGLLATHGDPNSNTSNTLVGADFLYRRNDLLGDQVLEIFGWAQQSASPKLSGDESAYGFRVAWPNDRYNGRIYMTEIGENFHPGLGFVNRRDIRQWNAELRRRFRPADSWIRTIDFFAGGRLVTDRDGRFESLQVDGTLVEVANQLGDFVALRSESRSERLDADFAIFPGVLVPADRYDFHRGIVALGTAESRPVSGTLSFGAGSFFSGHIRALVATLAWRPSRHFTASVEFEQNQVRLEEGRFTTRLGRIRLDVGFTPDLSWETFIQFDNVNDSLGWNSRFRWIIEPGRELVLVWNQGFDTQDLDLRSTATGVAVKLRWTLRF